MNASEKFANAPMLNGQDLISDIAQMPISHAFGNSTSDKLLNQKRAHSPEKENNHYNSNANTPSHSISTKNCSSAMSSKKDRNIVDFFKPYSHQKQSHPSPQAPLPSVTKHDFARDSTSVSIGSSDKLLLEKDREIAELKQILSDKENELVSLERTHQTALDKANTHLINSLKEGEQNKRMTMKLLLHEKKMKIGQQNSIRTIHGQILDVWEDGEEFIKVKGRLKEIQAEKDSIEKEKAKLTTHDISLQEDKKDLLAFQYLNISKEELYLKSQLEQIDQEKVKYLLQDSLFTEEGKCCFASKGKNPWPLLNNRFQVLSLLGKGGYSEVYKAYDIKEHTLVACKVFLINQSWPREVYENYIKHTFREIQIQKSISHSKVVKQITSFDIDGASYCTVLEYCTGPDLATYMKLNRNIQEQEAQKIIKQILLGLEYLNKQKHKIIHYDLKPQNVLFHNHEVKISDFGISKIVQSKDEEGDITQLTSQGIGTYWYLPPECFEASKHVKISNKVDIWSIGVILFEMLFGKKPFGQGCSQNKLIGIMLNARKVPFPLIPIISDDCKSFIQRCLSWKIEDRYDVFDALKSAFITKDGNCNQN